MIDCVFCRIIAGEEPATFIRRWPDAVAILPLKPVTDGHTLVIPAVHATDWTEVPSVSATAMWRASELAYDMAFNPSNLITSAGVEATQSVFHLHLHIVPRAGNDGLALPWYSGKRGKR